MLAVEFHLPVGVLPGRLADAGFGVLKRQRRAGSQRERLFRDVRPPEELEREEADAEEVD
jgi:hypothetical protein